MHYATTHKYSIKDKETKVLGGFPIKIEIQISELSITYSLAILYYENS